MNLCAPLKNFRFLAIFSKITTLLGNAKILAILALLTITVAAYIRVYDLGERSLWLDEAWLANAVSEDSLRGVMTSLESAPPLFVIVVHYIIGWLRNNEFTLRLLPCWFGIGSVILIFFLTRKLSNAKAALLALIPFAFAPKLVYYAKEFKQYSGDMFFAVLLVFLTERIIHRHSLKNWILFAVLASVALWFSHPMTFVVPGLALVLLYHSLTTGKDRTVLKQWFAAHLVIGIAWLALFSLIVQHQIIDSLLAFWQAHYPRTSSPRSLLFWLVGSHLNILDFGFRPNAWLALILIPIGLNEFFRKKCKRFLVYALFPLLLALTASFLHRYPYGGIRVMLFGFPLLFIAFGQGLFWTLSTLYGKRYFAATLIIALLIGWPAGSEIYNNLTKPVRREEMRPVLEYLKQNVKSDDQIYVYYGAKPAFKYYYQGNYKNVTLGESHRDDITKYAPEIDKILERDMRIWIVFSHYRWTRNEKEFLLSYLSKKGASLDSFEVTGASTYLYKIRALEGSTSSEYPSLGFLENFHRYSQVVSLTPSDKGWLLGSRVSSGSLEGDEYAKNPYVRLLDSRDQEIVRLVVYRGRIGEEDASMVYENSVWLSSLPANYKMCLGYEYGYESKSKEPSEELRFKEFHLDFGQRLPGYPLGDWSLEFFYQKLPPTHFAEYGQMVALFKSREKKILWSRIFGGELIAGNDYVENPYVRILDSQGNEIAKLLIYKGTVGGIGSVLGPRENSLILSLLPSEYQLHIGYQFYYDASHKGEAGGPLELKVETQSFDQITLEESKEGYRKRQLRLLEKLAAESPGEAAWSYARSAIPKLYLSKLTGEDRGIEDANGLLQQITPRFLEKYGMSRYYWALTYDIRAYYLFKDEPGLLYMDTRGMIEDRIWSYVKSHSSIDIPLDPWYFWNTENHMMWQGSTFLLAAQMFEDKRYEDGALGSEHYSFWKDWFSKWMDERAKKGWLEISSTDYRTRSMAGILNIYNFCNDATLRKKAEMTLDWLFADYAQEQIKGVCGGAKVRVNPDQSKSGDDDGIYLFGYLLFGDGDLKDWANLGLVHLATSEYHAPEVVIDLAVDRFGRGSYVVKARRPSAQWGEFKTRKYSYVTPDYILGVFQDNDRYSAYWNDRWVGLIFATSPEARIFPWGRKGGDDAPGQQRLDHEKYFQHKNVLIAQVGKAGTDYPTMTYFPNSLDKIDEEDDWVFVKEGSAYAAYKPVSGGYHWSGRYIVCNTKGVSAILEAARASDYSSFSDFKEDVKKRHFVYSEGIVEYENQNGDIIRVDFDNPEVNGQPVDLASYKTFDSPYIQSDWDSGYIKVSKGPRYLILDFTDPDNPKKIEGSIES